MNKLVKILLWTCLGLVTLIIAALLFTQTGVFRELVRKKALQAVNEQLNGQVYIDELKGNFFSRIRLNGIEVLLPEGDTLLRLDALELRYSLLSLRHRELKVRLAYMGQPYVHLTQNADGKWNFESLVPESDKEEDKSPAPFPFRLILDSFVLDGGNLFINSSDSLIPAAIRDLNIDIAGRYSSRDLRIRLNNLSFETSKPDFKLVSLSLQLNSDFQTWSLKNFKFRSALNEISAEGRYLSIGDFDAETLWQGINTGEFAFVLPDIELSSLPDLAFAANASNGNMQFRLSLQQRNESIELGGRIDNFEHLTSDSLRYTVAPDLELNFRNFRINNWIVTDTIPLILNCKLHITGNGIDERAETLRVIGDPGGTSWDSIMISSGHIDLYYTNGIAGGEFDLVSKLANISALASVDLKDEKGPFSIDLSAEVPNLGSFVSGILDSSYVWLEAKAKGFGLTGGNPEMDFSALVSNSLINGTDIDSLFIRGEMANHLLRLDTLILKNKSLNAAARGSYLTDDITASDSTTALSYLTSLNGKGSLWAVFNASINNLESFKSYYDGDARWEKLEITTEVSGSIDSISVELNAMLRGMALDTILGVGSLDLKASGLMAGASQSGKLALDAGNITAGSFFADSLSLKGNWLDSLLSVSLAGYLPDSVSLMLEAATRPLSEQSAIISLLELNSEYADLYLNNGDAIINYSDSLISISNFSLADRKDSLFALTANAGVVLPDSLMLKAEIRNFDMALLGRLGAAGEHLKGRAGITLDIGGSKDDIVIDAKTNLQNPVLEPLALAGLRAILHYEDGLALMDAAIINSLGDSLVLKGKTPLNITFSDSLTMQWPGTMDMRLTTANSRLSGFFLEMPGFQQPKAVLNLDLSMEGSTESPLVKGWVAVTDGLLPLPAYGINYEDIKLKASIDGRDIRIDTLSVHHLNGSLLAKGVMLLDSLGIGGSISSADITMVADQFYITRHRDFDIQVDADVFFNDKEGLPSFGGNLRVLRSNFNLPVLMKMSETEATLNDPLLVQALKEQQEHDVAEIDEDIPEAAPEVKKRDLMKLLTGKLNVELPRNTWIRSPDMQMELYGNLDVVKNSDIFELFGSAGIHRGYYTLYGKRFAIKEGELTFSGGEEFNPLINLKAAYTFRDKNKNKKILTLIIGGSLNDPDIAFELDGSSIPEADAMAYLLFGQPFDELSYSNQAGVSNAIPSRLLTGLISSQLSKSIGSALRLDMIEIDTGDSWQNTGFMVGKYITNNLFVTYQHRLGDDSNESVSPETITLEYELSRWLFLRLVQGSSKESGVDLILKIEKQGK